MFSVTISIAVAVSCLAATQPAAAGEAADETYQLGDPVPLDEHDLQAITLQVLENNPLLSSSPGIKFASAQRSVRSMDIADIIYFPHAESAGIKQAFQVQCRRQSPIRVWTCGEAEIRRYLQLESQDFEVRVTGGLGSEVALALIQATRDTAQAGATAGSVVPETAILIHPYGDGYLVSWGSHEGYQTLAVTAQLRNDGNPVAAEDWETAILELEVE